MAGLARITTRLGLGMLMAACAGTALANDFPTQARVEFVLSCMNEQGEQSYDTMYGCVCLVDRLAKQYSYADFTKVQTLSFLYATPGEKGGVFRDGVAAARDKLEVFREADSAARKACFPTKVSG